MTDQNEEMIKEAIRQAQSKAQQKEEETLDKAVDETEEAEETVETRETEADIEDADTETETDNQADETDENAQEASDANKKAFKFGAKSDKKKEKADKKKDKEKEKIEELEDKVKRQLAEFENFRNRSEKEKAAMFDMGARSVLEKILPVIDNFERGLETVPAEEADSPFADGMNKIYKQMITELSNIGVKPIEAVGKEFDPNLHNAVMQVASEEYESGVVAQEFQKGYTYKDTVIRHSMVGVVS